MEILDNEKRENIEIDYKKIQEAFENALDEHVKKNELSDEDLKKQEQIENDMKLQEEEKHKEILSAITDTSDDVIIEKLETTIFELQEQNQILQETNKNAVEGLWLVSLVIVTTLTVKLFFNQISKW